MTRHRDEFRCIKKMQTGEGLDAADRTIDRPLLNRRQDVAKRHRYWCRAKPLESRGLKIRGKDPDLLALKVVEMANCSFGDDLVRLAEKQANVAQSLIGAEPKHQLQHLQI